MAHKVLGNSVPKPVEEKKRKRSRRWCITINNYTEDDWKNCCTNTQRFTKWIFGKEIGEGGTPHVQGYIECKHPIDFASISKMFPRAHFERAKGNLKANYDYCSKEGSYETNIDLMPFRDKLKRIVFEKYYKDVVWRTWQEEVLHAINVDNDRVIYWYWEKGGNIGKSFLCKYIAIQRNGVIICDGKKDNVFNQVNTMIEAKVMPEIVLLDVPRTSLDFINYGVIEKLKDGMLYSGKYEGGICIFPSPVIICFANEKPDESKMSADRWVVVCLDEDSDSE